MDQDQIFDPCPDRTITGPELPQDCTLNNGADGIQTCSVSVTSHYQQVVTPNGIECKFLRADTSTRCTACKRVPVLGDAGIGF